MERNKPNTFFSKSLFLRGLKCYKSLYLQKYHPELKDELPESQQRLYETGFNVGCCARQLFPGGVEIPYERLSLQKQIQMTKEEIEHGTLTLYESAFQYNEIFIKSDILHKGSDGWELYEVKNALSIKDDNLHIEDVAIQYHVLRGSGLPVTKAFLVHLNGKYIKNGDIEIDKLFTIEDITERDLAVPFRKRAYYHYAMNGSSSIKAVFPVLIPGASYGGLEINNGMMAMDAYFRMCQSKDTEEIEAIRKALLEYCYTDTLAMVKIFHKLRELAC